LEQQGYRPGRADVNGNAVCANFTGEKFKGGRTQPITVDARIGHPFERVDTAQMLCFEPGFRPAMSDFINLERLAGQSGQGQGGPDDLPAAFQIRTVDVNHTPELTWNNAELLRRKSMVIKIVLAVFI
jgi:hypothetical protein